ncbi:PAS domain S-box protein [Stutzerimonas azotifigens]|uniref:PAS domain S-box protein n=1 Tax=Stutzerimonas azotifigens TaxID=291995 RepID=UPI0035C18BD3
MLAESALRLTQERFAALYRLAPVGIMLSRLSDARMLEWNPQLCRMSGYDDSALTNLDFLSLMPALAGDSQALNALIRDGFHGPYETLLRHADGTQVPVLLNGALMTGDDGQPLVWSIIQDITERAQAEQEVQERERYLRLLIANVIDAIIITDNNGTIETFNHAAERTFGYLEHEVLGRPLSLLLPETVALCNGQPDDHLSERQALDRELTAIRRDGEPFTVELRVSQVSHDGTRKYIGLVRDITERKRIERMKSEFVSIVSHELRTPLTSISGALGLINGGALGELSGPMRQMLGIAHQNSLRLGRLIDDLLDMDKLVAGKMAFNLRPLPLAPLLEEALRSHQAYAEQHQVRFVLEPVRDWQVMADETRLEQVLANFLSNAAKFSPPGEVVIVAVRAQGNGVRVSVTDRGPGIAPEFETRIFQKFSQADSSDTRQKGGTGLGLAISKELVERMHGRIGFDSRPGQGASFWFELPLADEVAETTR